MRENNKNGSDSSQTDPAGIAGTYVPEKIHIDAETKQLLVELKNGSQDAFQQIFYKWNRQIHAVLCRLLQSVEDAEDVTQDVFVKIWESREKIDTDKDIKNFIFLVARHTALKYLEKRKVRSNYLINLQYDDEDPLNSVDLLAAEETEQRAMSIVSSMPEPRQTIYRMSYQEDLDNGQISEKLHIPREKVAKELHLARKQLKSVLNAISMLIVLVKMF